jgi:hypothetical protein
MSLFEGFKELCGDIFSTLREAGLSVIGRRPQDRTKLGVEETSEGAAKPRYYEEIVQLLENHPEGLSLVEIGEELGVQWRSLTKTISQLLEEEEIEKEDKTYYPKV